MTRWKWVGEREFVPGVPPRDITEDEALARGVLELVKESPLYVKVEDEPELEEGDERT